MINECNRVDQAVVFTVVGVNIDCKKEILAVHLFWGNESINLWKKVFHDLKNRGRTRVLMRITDDVSSLIPVVKTLFPQFKHQCCHGHLLRNAAHHLNKDEYAQSQQQLDDSFVMVTQSQQQLLNHSGKDNLWIVS